MTRPARAVALIAALTACAGLATVPATAQTAGPTLSVDAAADRHTISADIYGMNWADPTLAAELRIGVDRWGGNATTRYNWQTGFWNTANDYFWETLRPGRDANAFVAADRSAGVSTMISVPTMGWVAKAGAPPNHPFACSFKVSKYGAQESTDPFDPDCGNGKTPAGAIMTGNDPTDASMAVGAPFVGSWVTDLVGRYGSAAGGGVRAYGLDNEAVLWSESHRDVHPLPTTYDELRDKHQAAAAAIKAADPTAAVAGPSDWGWEAYFDTRAPGDKAAHGNVDLAAWYLQQMKAYADAHGGQRILDVFDEHYYPQAAGVTLGPAGSAATQALRLRSTRSLWDPSYLDESWIAQCCNGKVMLLPRMHAWADANYPGTKIAVGEYNWGGLESVNGALAEADVLGIFARERADMAMLWDPPSPSQPGAFAFRMYRNYDGRGGSFGDTWVRSTSADQSKLSVYGAQHGPGGALTVMVVNKTGGDLQSPLNVAGFASAPAAHVYRYSGANVAAIQHPADVPVSSGVVTTTYPANSVTLLVVPPRRAVADLDGDGTTDTAVYTPGSGEWSAPARPATTWGTAGDVAVPGDYDGNGSTDLAVFRPSTGGWYVRGQAGAVWGTSTDIPVPGDYDGNGTTDIAVFRPSTGGWYVRGQAGATWGTSTDIPVPGDYDGNGTTDVAVFRPSTGAWYVQGQPGAVWGTSTDIPVPGDYDGNGTTDVAVFRPSTGAWYVRGQAGALWGTSTDAPVPGDYDGNGTTDVAVFRPSVGGWYVRGQAGAVWGTSTDVPLPLPWAIRRAFFP